MQFLRLRSTIRRSIIVVAVVGALLLFHRMLFLITNTLSDDPFHRTLLVIANIFTDDPFQAFDNSLRKVWDIGPSPSVTIDLFEGWITVIPSKDDKVAVDIETGVVTKFSQAAADEALKAIDLGFHRWGNSLRITARGLSKAGINNVIQVKLSVPRGVDLDLRTGRGNIYVGQDYLNGKWVHTPISASSIRAKNDSDYRIAHAQGSIVVVTLAPPKTPAILSTPTRIQLDAPGRIEIIADFAVVEAHAWHGNPPKQWSQGVYEAEDEGAISFEGSLAKGIHSLRAAHRIDMKLRRTSFLRIEAEAVAGCITGNYLPERVEPTGGMARWAGSLGPEGGGVLRLRTDDGPIYLNSSPPEGK